MGNEEYFMREIENLTNQIESMKEYYEAVIKEKDEEIRDLINELRRR